MELERLGKIGVLLIQLDRVKQPERRFAFDLVHEELIELLDSLDSILSYKDAQVLLALRNFHRKDLQAVDYFEFFVVLISFLFLLFQDWHFEGKDLFEVLCVEHFDAVML